MASDKQAMYNLIKKVAQKRGVKIKKLPYIKNIQLLYNDQEEHLIDLAITEASSSLGTRIAKNKFATGQILKRHGLPIPRQKLCTSIKEARQNFRNNKNIIIKPVGLSLGWGVTLSIKNDKDLVKAVNFAKKESLKNVVKYLRGRFLIEEKVPGLDYRVSVTNFKNVYAVLRTPAYVTGDGRSNISQLIKKKNQRKMPYKGIIGVDAQTKKILKKEGYTLRTVLPKGKEVTLKDVANICAGGESKDVTDQVSPHWRRTVIKVAKILNMPVAGIDVISPDISANQGKIIEVNGRAHLILHHYPHQGKPRDPVGDMIDSLFSKNK